MKSVSDLHRIFFAKTTLCKETLMPINTINHESNHPKLIKQKINSNKSLPFTDILSPEELIKSFSSFNYRERCYTPDLVLFAFLSQAINADKSYQAAVVRVITHVLAKGGKPPSANTAAYCKARARLPEDSIKSLTKEHGQLLENKAPKQWLWRDRHVKLVDGSTVSMPDTKENQAIYPQSKSQKPGLGFPVARIVGVVSLATGALLDLAVGRCSGKGTGEHALFREIISVLQPKDILLGDRYYPSYTLLAHLTESKIDGVFPIHAGKKADFRRGKCLGKGDHLVTYTKPQRPEWMDQETYENVPETITLRETEITIKKKGFRPKKKVLVTTFLDPVEVTKDDLALLYNERWLIETNLKAIKETMQMGVLGAKTPEMFRKELWVHLLAYNLIRKIMAQAAHTHSRLPQQLSFKLAMQFISSFIQVEFLSENCDEHLILLQSITYKKVRNRPGRREPRAIKRRPKPFRKLRTPREQYKNGTAKKAYSLS